MSKKSIAASAALLVAAGMLLAAAVPDAPGAAPVATPECIAGTFKAKTETADYSLNLASGDFVNVPGTGVGFRQGAAGCVLLMFSSWAQTNNNQIRLRAVIDGGTHIAQPLQVDFTTFAEETFGAARAFNFVFQNIPAGTHTAIVQAAPAFPSGSAKLGERSTVVFYRK
jgi:hypothetical protein